MELYILVRKTDLPEDVQSVDNVGSPAAAKPLALPGRASQEEKIPDGTVLSLQLFGANGYVNIKTKQE